MFYEVGECYTFDEDTEQGWSAWMFMSYGWMRVA
jgi:hypothetical protein